MFWEPGFNLLRFIIYYILLNQQKYIQILWKGILSWSSGVLLQRNAQEHSRKWEFCKLLLLAMLVAGQVPFKKVLEY